MRLSNILTENAAARLNKLISQHPQKQQIINNLLECDPTKNGKYALWLAKLYNSNKITIKNVHKATNQQLILPEDKYKITEALQFLEKYKPGINALDYDWYGLDDALDKFRKSNPQNHILDEYPGGEIIYDDGVYKIFKFNKGDKEAIEGLMQIGLGTKWCTRADYKDPKAERYLSRVNVYTVLKDGSPFAQGDRESGLLDVRDQEFDPPSDLVRVLISIPRSVEEGIDVAFITEMRQPEIEPYILKDPEVAYNYADNVIGGRWPEAEPYIMKDPGAAYYYAVDVIKDRWPEAEPTIMKNPDAACYYAFNVIGGRWHEAEPYIIKDPVIAVNYAYHVIKGRWPEAEPTIMKDPPSWQSYKSLLLREAIIGP